MLTDLLSVEGWKALGTVLSGFAQVLGVAGGAWYFLAQKRHGAQKPNLSVLIACERRASDKQDTDWLSITVTLKKLDRGMLGLLLVRARISDGNDFEQEVNFWGKDLVKMTADGSSLDWKSGDGGELNLTPGEETQLAAVSRVATDAAYHVGVVIRAYQHGDNRLGQWQASTVSLPKEPKIEAAQTAAVRAFEGDKASSPDPDLPVLNQVPLVNDLSRFANGGTGRWRLLHLLRSVRG
jgi:hypothetical protein